MSRPAGRRATRGGETPRKRPMARTTRRTRTANPGCLGTQVGSLPGRGRVHVAAITERAAWATRGLHAPTRRPASQRGAVRPTASPITTPPKRHSPTRAQRSAEGAAEHESGGVAPAAQRRPARSEDARGGTPIKDRSSPRSRPSCRDPPTRAGSPRARRSRGCTRSRAG